MVGQVLTGNGITAYGDGHRSPISGSIKYRVLTRARGRCECCGAGKREASCVFCALEGSGRVLLENELALCIGRVPLSGVKPEARLP